MKERSSSPGAGSPEARHSRDTVLFSRMTRSTVLGSMLGGTATQHTQSAALHGHSHTEQQHGHGQAHRGTQHVLSPGSSQSSFPALEGDHITTRCHCCSPSQL